MDKIKRFKIGTIVSVTIECREVDNNYLVKPYRYILKGYKKVYDDLCAKITMFDFNDVETKFNYLVPADKIYKI